MATPQDEHEEQMRAIRAERDALAARRLAWPQSVIRGALYAVSVCVILTVAGFVLTNDPWFGGHAEVFCPLLCESCRGPYHVRFGEGSSSREPPIECSTGSLALSGQPTAEVGLLPLMASGAGLWLVVGLVFCVPIVLSVDARELRDRRRDREADLDAREADLEWRRRQRDAG